MDVILQKLTEHEFRYEKVPVYPQWFEHGDIVAINCAQITREHYCESYPVTDYHGQKGMVIARHGERTYPDDEGFVEVLTGDGRRMSVLYSQLMKVT